MKIHKGRHGVEKSFFTVYLPSKYREALRQLAAHEDTTMSEIVRALIKARVEHLTQLGE